MPSLVVSTPGDVLQAQVDDLALDGRHRLELDRAAGLHDALGGAHGERVERRLAPVAVAGRVDDDRLAGSAAVAVDDRVREVLERVDRLAVLADQEAEVAARAGGDDRLVVLVDLDAAADAERGREALEQLAARGRGLALVRRRPGGLADSVDRTAATTRAGA